MYEDAKRNHKELWDFIVNNPERTEREWPGWESNGGYVDDIFNHCFACYIARKLVKRSPCGSTCEFCPINWEYGIRCVDNTSLWSQYMNRFRANDYEAVKKIATLIRDIPWKG